MPFRTRRRVEFADTDMAGIVHFSNFFRYMEAAEVDFLCSLGLAVTLRWEGHPISFPRVAAACDFLRPVTFQDQLDIAVTVLRLGTKSVTYGFEFFKGDEVIARGQVSSVCCRVLPDHRLESIEIPTPLREALSAACGQPTDK